MWERKHAPSLNMKKTVQLTPAAVLKNKENATLSQRIEILD